MSTIDSLGPLARLPTVQGRGRMRACIIDIPDAEFFTCHELAQVIADALERPFGEVESAYPKERATWIDPSTINSIYLRSHAARLLVKRLRQYRGAPYSSRWDPSMVPMAPTKERWLAECGRRLQDLQDWVTRKELLIFTSGRTKAQAVAPGTYLKRADAVRYCKESGFEVADLVAGNAPHRSAPPMPSATSTAEIEGNDKKPIKRKNNSWGNGGAQKLADYVKNRGWDDAEKKYETSEKSLRTALKRNGIDPSKLTRNWSFPILQRKVD
jgi:hypothetical protein